MLGLPERLAVAEVVGKMLAEWELRSHSARVSGSPSIKVFVELGEFLNPLFAMIELVMAQRSACLAKAAPEEPIFVLRGQDKTAATLVRLWVMMNVEEQRKAIGDATESTVKYGMVVEKIAAVAEDLMQAVSGCPEVYGDKLVSAAAIAKAMDQWTVKKIAD